MGDLKDFKREIFLATMATAAFAEILSLLIYRPSLWFAAGLAAGTGITMLAFHMLAQAGMLVGKLQSSGLIVAGFLAGMVLYGVAFFICVRISLPCGFGCVAGFLSLHMGILVLYGIIYRFSKKKNPLNDWVEPKKWKDPGTGEKDGEDAGKEDGSKEDDARYFKNDWKEWVSWDDWDEKDSWDDKDSSNDKIES